MLEKILTPVLAVALAVALGLAGWQWGRAMRAEGATERVRTEFATYRETQERNARAALVAAAQETRRQNQLRQEAIDAEHHARVAAEADAARLRAGNGQLQRLASDLSTSLADRARDPAAAGSCKAAGEQFAFVVGALDDFAAEAGAAADDARRAGQLCERTFDALMPPPAAP